MLNKIDKRIDALQEECESEDAQEEGQESLVKTKENLKDQEKLKSKMKDIIKELETENKKSLNTTDDDCTTMKSIHGSHACYNVQNVVDAKHGLIVNTDAINENNDKNQFANQIDQANEVLESKCKIASGDSGYANTTELEKIEYLEAFELYSQINTGLYAAWGLMVVILVVDIVKTKTITENEKKNKEHDE